MTHQLVPVSFYGDTLEAAQDDSGKVWVSIRRGCENLGLATEVQLRKLKSKPWATVTEMVTVAEDGKQRALTVIDLDSLPGWLFSIDARKAKEHVREKLIRYQKEAAKVLADHFFRRHQQPQPSTPDVSALAAAIRQIVVDTLRTVVPDSQRLAADSASGSATRPNKGRGPFAMILTAIRRVDPKGEGVTSADLVERATAEVEPDQELAFAIRVFCGKLNSGSLGSKLRHKLHSFSDGYYLDSFMARSGARAWIARPANEFRLLHEHDEHGETV